VLAPGCLCGAFWPPIIHVGEMDWAQADAGGYTFDFRQAKQCPKCGAFWQPVAALTDAR